MTRNSVLKVINPLLLILFILQILTGYFQFDVAYFSEIHEIGAILLIIFLILHIIFNWKWIKTNILKIKA